MALDKSKILYIDSLFAKSADATDQSIYVEGYASTNDVDRAGDVVSAEAWKEGLDNYLNNPIILAYHDNKQPIGRMVEHRFDSKGLWIKARISQAAGNIFNLIKDGVLTAFSIGFQVKKAEYKPDMEVFYIKEVELHEISVVPVPCNQNTLFSLSKAFETAEDYSSYKMLFAAKDVQAKELADSTADNGNINKGWKMNPEEIQAQIEAAAKKAAEVALAADREARAKAAQEAEAKAKLDAELDAKIKSAVQVTVGGSGAEKLLAEVEKRIASQTAEAQKGLEDVMAAIKEKAEELKAIQSSKMQFSDKGSKDADYADVEKAVMLAKMTGKALENTKFGRKLVEKTGQHQASSTWEHEVSLRMEDEVRRRLVVAPTLRNIQMQTNVMTMPLNPEAGYGTWVTNAQFGTNNSSGATAVHQLKEITLNAYKLATREYMAYEEEEDSLIVLMPIVRDAMIRRVAKSVDKAFINGTGSGSDPVLGLGMMDASSAVTETVANKATVAKMIALRRDLGAWGLDPSEVTYVVSTDVYYDLLEDASFQTVDKIGDRATLLTGQIGTISNSPVLVSAEMPTKASGTITAAGNIGAIAYNTRNFVVGNQRGLRIDTQDLVESQQKVLVASLRTGMTKLTTNLGDAVSALRWVAGS